MLFLVLTYGVGKPAVCPTNGRHKELEMFLGTVIIQQFHFVPLVQLNLPYSQV